MLSRPLTRSLTWPLTWGDADPDAKAFFDALPDPEPDIVKEFINAYIVGLKADGLWSKIDGGNILCLGTVDNCLVDFRNPSRVATLAPGWTGTFTPYRGTKGSGAASGNQTDYIDTGFVPSTAGGAMTQDSAHIAVYSRSAGQSAAFSIGCNGASDLYLRERTAANVSDGRSNNVTTDTFASSVMDGSGFFILSREGAAVSKVYRNGVGGSTVTTASVALPNVALRYLQIQAAAGTTGEKALGCYGAGLNAQEAGKLDARAQPLIGALTVM